MIDQNNQEDILEAIELMYYAYRCFTTGPDKILEKRGLNRVHHRILYFVGRYPGLSVNNLLEILQISKQALNLPLRQLVGMDLVVNKKSARDGRVKELRLTKEGRGLESRLTQTQSKLFEQVFAVHGKRAEKSWREIMQALGAPPA